MVKVSIILPVLNEEKNITKTLACLQHFRRAGHEVIIVDGGSQDNTLLLANDYADKLIVSHPGRAMQMNNGAAAASGDIFLFLHADTFLPADALQKIALLAAREALWGRFDLRLSGDRIIFRLIERLINLRSRITSVATGDQAMFVERGIFEQINGFPEIALMEDVALSKSLKKRSSAVCLKQQVITSSRRWEQHGVMATVLLMWKLRLYYFFGVSPEKLGHLYR